MAPSQLVSWPDQSANKATPVLPRRWPSPQASPEGPTSQHSPCHPGPMGLPGHAPLGAATRPRDQLDRAQLSVFADCVGWSCQHTVDTGWACTGASRFPCVRDGADAPQYPQPLPPILGDRGRRPSLPPQCLTQCGPHRVAPGPTELLSDGGRSPPHSSKEAAARAAPCPVLAEMPLVCGFGSWAKTNSR